MAWRLKSNTSARTNRKEKRYRKERNKKREKEKKRKKRIKYKEIWRLKSKTGGIGLVYFTCPIRHKISEPSSLDWEYYS